MTYNITLVLGEQHGDFTNIYIMLYSPHIPYVSTQHLKNPIYYILPAIPLIVTYSSISESLYFPLHLTDFAQTHYAPPSVNHQFYVVLFLNFVLICLFFKVSHISDITWHFSFSVQSISLSITPCRSILSQITRLHSSV